ncbi:hypothetical protein BHE74_00031086 [Ensete ventricosum]|nr:hypothetical protein BHE74_00031086 [Ensete ventricosum]
MGSHTSKVSRKNTMVINLARSGTSTVSRKKYDGHKLCARSRAESSFERFFVPHLGNSKYGSFMTY